jgi:hypothetical protein
MTVNTPTYMWGPYLGIITNWPMNSGATANDVGYSIFKWIEYIPLITVNAGSPVLSINNVINSPYIIAAGV